MRHKIPVHCGCTQPKWFWCLNEVLDFVELKESTLSNAGVGLFATQDIPNNTALGWYKGDIVKSSIAKAYAWNFKSDLDNRPKKLEALIHFVGNPLAYVNSFKNEEEKKLLNLNKFINKERIYYKTLRKIKAGEELIIDYGNKNYFKYHNIK